MELLQVKNMSFRYAGAERPALTDLSFSIKEGEFVVILGESGCGKTTLLRLLKRELAPHGEKTGHIYYKGVEQSELDERRAACEIGCVLQHPEDQMVTDKVWHELAFGLENLGYPSSVIRRRVSEIASYFGIQGWFRKDIKTLSGGQKQMLNLASVMVMQPDILILDEPTAQLDPVASSELIHTLRKLNQELGLTILLVEHCLEEVFPLADRVMMMDRGKIMWYDHPKKVGEALRLLPEDHPLLAGLPSAVQIFYGLDQEGDCPLTVKDARKFLETHFDHCIDSLERPPYQHSEIVEVEMKNIWFRYEKELPDVLRGISFSVYQGETFCLLGGNGTGKTTLLHVLAGLQRPYRGNLLISGKKAKEWKGNSLYRNGIALLPQDPQTLFLKNTLREDFQEICKAMEIPKGERDRKIDEIAGRLDVASLLSHHPYDLSGGEQQKAALAKILLLNPRILLLDEPTKGIDAHSKKRLSDILQVLKKDGMTIVIVTHDVEFAAENADRCALIFDGEITSVDTPFAFFEDNMFYTTAANRIARGRYRHVVSSKDVVELCRRNQKDKEEDGG